MTMQTFTMVDISIVAGGIAGAIALILRQTQKSRCRKCSILYGCISCDRDVPDIENQKEDEEKTTISIKTDTNV